MDITANGHLLYRLIFVMFEGNQYSFLGTVKHDTNKIVWYRFSFTFKSYYLIVLLNIPIIFLKPFQIILLYS